VKRNDVARKRLFWVEKKKSGKLDLALAMPAGAPTRFLGRRVSIPAPAPEKEEVES